jgi:hypothetical protein
MNQLPQVLPAEWNIFRARAKIVNIEAGLLAISLAGVALDTEAPRLFALLSMATVLLFLAYRLQSFERVCRLWREVNHPLVKTRNVWRFFPIFNIGWLLLGFILLGAVHKGGIFGLSF